MYVYTCIADVADKSICKISIFLQNPQLYSHLFFAKQVRSGTSVVNLLTARKKINVGIVIVISYDCHARDAIITT